MDSVEGTLTLRRSKRGLPVRDLPQETDNPRKKRRVPGPPAQRASSRLQAAAKPLPDIKVPGRHQTPGEACRIQEKRQVEGSDLRNEAKFDHACPTEESTSNEVRDRAKDQEKGQQVCFGMITHFSVRLFDSKQGPGTFGLSLGTSCTMLNKSDGRRFGRLDDTAARILQVLEDDPDIELQIQCQIGMLNQNGGEGERTSKAHSPMLSVIIYGSMELFEPVGKLFELNNLFLQDPKGCNREVEYRNPHLLFALDLDRQITSIEAEMSSLVLECTSTPFDILRGFENGETLPEAVTPSGLRIELYSHQKQALTFMKRRERGWQLLEPFQDVWSRVNNRGSAIYVNNINGRRQHDAPPPFRGGIIADYMGLGKSLSVIALIASDKDANYEDVKVSDESLSVNVRTTLVIVPSTLLDSWEDQLSKHLQADSLRWRRHHGKQRLRDASELEQVDIVLTTFQTLANEWKRSISNPTLLFAVQWRRIILDEAHCIKDSSTLTARAAQGLRAHSRWAVTGTPIQNGLPDLVSLFQFLKVYPYSDPRVFDSDITQVWKEKGSDAAIKRLKMLLNYIMLRRSQSAIQLPPRQDLRKFLEFSPHEKEEYEKARKGTIGLLDHELSSGIPSRDSYINALQRINTLRMLCNLGLTHALPDSIFQDDLALEDNWTTSSARRAFENLLCIGQATCSNCSEEIEGPEAATQLLLSSGRLRPQLFQCLYLWCGSCVLEVALKDGHGPNCGYGRYCRSASISSLPLSGVTHQHLRSSVPQMSQKIPTKIKTLISDLRVTSQTKSIVFSVWTSTLDLVASALEQDNIAYERYDGKVTAKNRAIVLGNFEKDPHIKVLLLSITCGAVGLNLTAASEVYLIEPHWNPTVEEQALARIHRIGQTREVRTVRYIMKNTIEEHVTTVQEYKRQLADVLLSQNQPTGLDLAHNRLQHLRSLLD